MTAYGLDLGQLGHGRQRYHGRNRRQDLEDRGRSCGSLPEPRVRAATPRRSVSGGEPDPPSSFFLLAPGAVEHARRGVPEALKDGGYWEDTRRRQRTAGVSCTGLGGVPGRRGRVMDLKEALTTAIKYETKVHDHYARARSRSSSPQGKKVFATLAKEELGHVAYLDSRLEEWHKNGKITTPELATILPPWTGSTRRRPGWRGAPDARSPSRTRWSCSRRPDLERQTSGFYRQLVETFPAPPSAICSRASSRSSRPTSSSSRPRSTRSPATGPGST